MNKYIIHCKCGDTAKFSKDAFRILFPDEELPPMYGGREEIIKLAESLPDNNFSRYLKVLHNNRVKFTYYFEVGEDGNVIRQINLKTGARVC